MKICFILSLFICASTFAQQKYKTWSAYGGDAGGTRYSSLTQINDKNVGRLNKAWTFRTGELATYEGTNAAEKAAFEATPVIVDNTLFFSTPSSRIFALDPATGKEIWKHSYAADLGPKYFQGGTTGTPTIDGDKLYWLSRWGDLFCFEAATGKIAWEKNIQKEAGLKVPDWGFTGAPYVHKNLLVLNVGDAGMAVEKTTR